MAVALAPAPSMFAVFRKRDFRLIWLAQLISTAGSSLTDLAAGIWVYEKTGSALAVGLTLMATAVPSLIVGLLAGVYVDRHDRKRIMTVTCLIQAVIVGFLAVTVQLDLIIGLYALILLNAGIKQFFDPAYDSLIPEMATDEELNAANAFLSIASFGSTAIGFAGAGLLASTVGLSWAFILDAISFLVCAGLISLMGRYPMPTPDDDATVAVIVANLSLGMKTLFGTPIIRSLFIVGAFMFVSFGLWNVLLLPFSIKTLGATEFQYGLQEGLTSVGFVVGSLLMARFSRLLPEPAWIVFSLVGMGIMGLGYATSTSIPVAILFVMMSGLLQPPSSVSRSVLLQRNTPREMRGRVFSAFYVMRDVIFLIGMAAAGLADCRRHPPPHRVRLLPAVRLGRVHARRPGPRRVDVGRGRPPAARRRDRPDPGRQPGPGRDPRRLRPTGRTSRRVRPSFARTARGVHRQRLGARDRGRHADRRTRRRRDDGLVHPRGRDDGRDPRRGRLSWPLDDAGGRLLRRDRRTDRAAPGPRTSWPTRTRRSSRCRRTPCGPPWSCPRSRSWSSRRSARAWSGPSRRTCRAWPACRRPSCATCGRRDHGRQRSARGGNGRHHRLVGRDQGRGAGRIG